MAVGSRGQEARPEHHGGTEPWWAEARRKGAGDWPQEGPSVQTMPVLLEPKGVPTLTPTCHF